MMVAPFDRLFLEADVLLAVGTQLSDLDWWALDGPFAPAGRIIRVDLDAEVLDANAAAEIGLVGDAAAVLDALAAALPATCCRPRCDRRVRARGRGGSGRSAGPRRSPRTSRSCARSTTCCPPDRIVAVDSTQPGYAANHALDVDTPGSWLMPIGYGCLGTALPMAIGACLAAPDRPVLAIAGDGGVLFTLPELAAARDLGLSLPLIVWNNGGYGEIRDAMRDVAHDGARHRRVRRRPAARRRGLRLHRRACREPRPRPASSSPRRSRAPVPTLIEVTPRTRGVDGGG